MNLILDLKFNKIADFFLSTENCRIPKMQFDALVYPQHAQNIVPWKIDSTICVEVEKNPFLLITKQFKLSSRISF